MDEGFILLIVGGVLAASIVVALGASRTGVPSPVAFLALGMLLGSAGLGGVEFDDAELAPKVGVVALAAILFEGGLATSWRRLREPRKPAPGRQALEHRLAPPPNERLAEPGRPPRRRTAASRAGTLLDLAEAPG